MNEGREEDRLKNAEKRLYQRDFAPQGLNRSKLSPKAYEVKTGWGEEEFSVQPKKPKNKMLLKILWASFVFFVVALVAAAFVLFGGVNVISDDEIDLQIDGPSSVKAGDEVSLQITVTNNNATALQSADLIIQYPPGSKTSMDSSGTLPIFRQSIGEIKTGEVVNVSSRAIVFGNQNSREQVKVSLEYRLPGSNAIFKKAEYYEYLIGSSPIDVSVQMPSEINASKEFAISIKTVSNSQALLRNVILSVDFPPGFQFRRSEPSPTYGKNVWSLGDVSAGSEREIKLTGVLEGQNEDTKSFRFNLGSQDGDVGEINLKYLDIFKTITLKKPFVALDLAVNGNSSDTVSVSPKGEVGVTGKWVNNLSSAVKNARVEVRLEGGILDKSSVGTQNGFFRSLDNTLIWDSSQLLEWKEIPPGDSGDFSFGFKSLPIGASGVANPEINMVATFYGERESAGLGLEEVKTEISRKIKFQTVSQFSARATYSVGPFTNTGPWPPKADQETTYTLNWFLSNSSNEIENSKVTAVLPVNVKWLGQTSPSAENISYDASSRRITWNVGTLGTSGSTGGLSKNVSFQVALTPSLSQVGKEAELLKESSFSGYDSFAGVQVNLSQGPLSTKLSGDPSFTTEKGLVTK